ncbi:hypothetical protein [uncultured Imperialibacter sp.]|uniref:hypothetical protein n=1 Tax=uncultured Imperialibacter sp. TaxID=1672639 RepID=UPI0030DACD36
MRLTWISLLAVLLWMASADAARAQLLEGRNKLKTVDEKPENPGFFLNRKKGRSEKNNAGRVSRKDRKVDTRTVKRPKKNIRQGANYQSTGGGVSIDNSPRSSARFSEPEKVSRRKSKVKYRSNSEKASKQRRRVPMIRLSPKIGIYNPNSPNPRYSKNPGFDRTKRYAASPRYSVPQPRVSPQSVNPRYSQSQGFVVKKGGYVIGFKNTPGILPIAKAGPRYSKPQKRVSPESVSPRYSKAPKQVSPGSVSPRYSESQGFVTNKSKWIFGFRKTPGILPIAKAGPRYSKPQKRVSPESVSPRYSVAPKQVSPKSVSPRYSVPPKLVSPGSVSPRYSKAPKQVSPESVSPRYSKDQGFVVKKGGWVIGFNNTSGFLPIGRATPRYSKEAGFYRPGNGVNRSISDEARQFSLPDKEKRRDNNYNPLVSTHIPTIVTTPRDRSFRKRYNEMITDWQGDEKRVSKFAEKLQDKGYALMYNEYRGFLKVRTEGREKHHAEKEAGRLAEYTGGFKIKRGAGDSHPSIAYVTGKKINSRKLRKEWRELNIILVRVSGNKEVAKGVKNGPDKPKYDKKERDIWNY